MVDPKGTRDLIAASQAGLIDFLLTDLAMCSTFADVAKIELASDRQHALKALRNAERGCEIIEYFVMRIQDATRRQEIEQKLNLLRSRLTAIKSELGLD